MLSIPRKKKIPQLSDEDACHLITHRARQVRLTKWLTIASAARPHPANDAIRTCDILHDKAIDCFKKNPISSEITAHSSIIFHFQLRLIIYTTMV
jgi:hypothetical protein